MWHALGALPIRQDGGYPTPCVYDVAQDVTQVYSIPRLVSQAVARLVSTMAFFDPVGGASAAANDEALRQLSGLEERDVLMSCWNNSRHRCGRLLTVLCSCGQTGRHVLMRC